MLALLTVWRWALLPTAELCPDEALALLYSKHSALWHLEMGPLVPWLIRVSTAMIGATEFGVRFFAPVLAFVTSVCVWRMGRSMFSDTAAAWAVVVIQVLPAFNMAALSMTSCIVGLTAVAGFIVTLRHAMMQPERWHRSWFISASCLLAAMLTDWRNALAFLCACAALGFTPHRRRHLRTPGFAIVATAFVMGSAMFIAWNVREQWPIWEAGEAEPLWLLWPNVLRWVLLASPVLLVGIGWALRQFWRERTTMPPDVPMLIIFAAAYALLDFGWGPRERWPHMGFPIWLLCGVALLAHYNLGGMNLSVNRKVLLRTVAVMLAAMQGMVLMRTDLLRVIGLVWPYQTTLRETHTYRDFLRADPSSTLEGWSKGMEVVDAVIASTRTTVQEPWFIIARSWPLAVELNAYLPGDVPLLAPSSEYPRAHALLHIERDQPLALLPRYDARHNGSYPFAKQHALYVSDDTEADRPPPEIRRAFARWETLSVVRVMHGGHPVRTLKIFACHGYQPPDV
jgi:hypothetical protein